MSSPERSVQRDAALLAMLPHVENLGWSVAAVRAGLGADAGEAAHLFLGPLDMVEAYIDYADRRMEREAADLQEPRLSRRVRALVASRLAQAREERPAIRRAMALLALPMNAPVAARTLARTVDSIWHAAGDRSADFSWYTKRATLAAVYTATLLHWLNQDPYADPEDEASLAFLDRRLAGVGRIGKLRRKLADALSGHRPKPRSPTPVPGAIPLIG